MSNEIATRKVGRPLKFPSPDKLQEKIDEYFNNCEAKKKPCIVTGLALWLDTSRETLMDYQNKDDFSDTILRAKLRCQAYAEEQLYTAKSAQGPIFALKNFGWKDRQDIDVSNNLVYNIPEELRKLVD